MKYRVLTLGLVCLVACHNKSEDSSAQKPADSHPTDVTATPSVSNDDPTSSPFATSTEPKVKEADADFRLISLAAEDNEETTFVPMKLNRALTIHEWTFHMLEYGSSDGYREKSENRAIRILDGRYFQDKIVDGKGGVMDMETQESISSADYEVMASQAKCSGYWIPIVPKEYKAEDDNYWNITKDTVIPVAASRFSDSESDALTLIHGTLFTGDFLTVRCKDVKAGDLTLGHLRTLMGSKVSLKVPVKQ